MKKISLDYKKSQQEIEWDDSCRKARMDAITFIGISKKTSGKVAGWLLKKGYPDSIVDFVIKELESESSLNDESLAKILLNSKRDKKAESAVASYQRLVRLGIDKEIARKCVEISFKDVNRELSDAITLLRLKFSSKMDTIHEMDNIGQLKLKQKVFRFLLNRGYSREVALRAMNNVLKDITFNEE